MIREGIKKDPIRPADLGAYPGIRWGRGGAAALLKAATGNAAPHGSIIPRRSAKRGDPREI